MVETLSDRGVFGPGNFTDHSTLDIGPALFLGLAAALAIVVRWLRGSGAIPPDRVLIRLLPSVVVMQLAILWLMENLEQIIVYHRCLGGTLWLGGPVAVSVIAHAVTGVIVTFALARLLRRSARAIAGVVAIVIALLDLGDPKRARVVVRRRNLSLHCALEPLIRRLSGRAPPPVLTSVLIAL